MNKKVLKVLEFNKILSAASDYAACAQSKEIILSLVPSSDFEEVKTMQEETSQASSMLAMYAHPPIAPVHPVYASVKRAQMEGILSIKELMNIGAVLRVSSQLLAFISKTDKLPILSAIASAIMVNKKLSSEITSSFISEELVADSASPQLAALRRKKNTLNNKIKDTLNSMIHSPSVSKYLQEPIVTMRGDRYVLPVKNENRSNVPGLLHDSSATGATVFIEPAAIVQINNELKDISIEEEREIERILADFSSKVAEFGENIIINYDVIVRLDVLFAKASYSNKMKCICPELNQEGILCLVQARHPLIATKQVVPIDVTLGKDFDTLVVTGPNTGGKTVSLKTVGLLSIMCQSGFHIPAEIGTHMPVFENIFADIGDEQSIEQSLSTFSSHMVNIVDILKNVMPNSLVLFDELGAGTDPVEGAALAIEILETVKKFGAKTVATTHYSELKMYALSTDRVENASCEFDVSTLKPTYRLLIGIPGKSNAFAISKRLGLSEYIISGAEKRISSDSVKFEDIVTELETKRDELGARNSEADKLLREAEKIRQEIEAEKRKIDEKKNKILEDARIKARNIVENAKEETSSILKEFRKLQLSGKNHLAEMEKLQHKMKDKSDNFDKKLAAKKVKSNTKAEDIRLGMKVKILSLDETGDVISLPNSNGEFSVQVGIIKVKTNVSDVMPAQEKKYDKEGEKIIKTRSSLSSKSLKINTELDLRGFMAHEAIMETDKFIDDCLLASLKQVSLIHGKGTGALRAAVHEYLRNNKFVKNFRLGSYGEGDTGVTIVELK